MTVLVGFNCVDGVVIAADSMITPSVGGISVGHHHGQKISILSGQQIFALAGDQGQNDRVRILADGIANIIPTCAHALDFPITLTQNIVQQFRNTGIADHISASPMLAFHHGGTHHFCVFEGRLQPRLLDANHYYAASGSGKLSADPFLRFLTDVFCQERPTVREAIFLATWAVQHVIDVNPGGVDGPIRIATLTRNSAGIFEAITLSDTEIAEHQQAIESAAEALRGWRDKLQSGMSAKGAPDQPSPPAS